MIHSHSRRKLFYLATSWPLIQTIPGFFVHQNRRPIARLIATDCTSSQAPAIAFIKGQSPPQGSGRFPLRADSPRQRAQSPFGISAALRVPLIDRTLSGSIPSIATLTITLLPCESSSERPKERRATLSSFSISSTALRIWGPSIVSCDQRRALKRLPCARCDALPAAVWTSPPLEPE